MTRNPDALAELFTPDGIYEAPLVPKGHAFPRRLAGRAEIRAGMAAYYERFTETDGTVNVEQSRYVLHATADPDVFIAEIDTVLDGADESTTMSLVQIFRLSEGKIALLRDYFAADTVD
ncbi:nuclear transport factor 2 family protein [Micromonospora sp. KC213]|uniref:nuclear transport factor 2 family protein n=1 Tax=Micromonospora sp. KC213 TaxID=2530378 RepID=UPI00104297BE|nr:nuclear transport factor 2 family protein [Micromonospora sp. KC213]TDC29996.1 nuclear transport factor 2 family protein [Micromonospora sp. KC213]